MRTGRAVFALLHHLQHVRNHFAGALDQHGVANVQSQPLDLVHIVQRGAADGDAADLHRLEKRHRRQRARAPDLTRISFTTVVSCRAGYL